MVNNCERLIRKRPGRRHLLGRAWTPEEAEKASRLKVWGVDNFVIAELVGTPLRRTHKLEREEIINIMLDEAMRLCAPEEGSTIEVKAATEGDYVSVKREVRTSPALHRVHDDYIHALAEEYANEDEGAPDDDQDRNGSMAQQPTYTASDWAIMVLAEEAVNNAKEYAKVIEMAGDDDQGRNGSMAAPVEKVNKGKQPATRDELASGDDDNLPI
ncbi:hypothetical protein F53441_1555 [Fusarium austroafricanum]|uniref:Uncharacterized protein n=1 Tax=Fusarium austroafricanum TaxID=2364996 RepID=A0A8H4KRU5_9HYPO|nr:hypothetical protein F53441_1555 [Fusarium austroafricanum]